MKSTVNVIRYHVHSQGYFRDSRYLSHAHAWESLMHYHLVGMITIVFSSSLCFHWVSTLSSAQKVVGMFICPYS
jgi:hypothetical protein